MTPDHAPEAEQEVVFVEDQVSVEDPPLATDDGFAASETVGAVGGGGAELWVLLPLHAAMISGTNSHAIKRLRRRKQVSVRADIVLEG